MLLQTYPMELMKMSPYLRRMSNYYDSRLSDCEVDLFHFSAKGEYLILFLVISDCCFVYLFSMVSQ